MGRLQARSRRWRGGTSTTLSATGFGDAPGRYRLITMPSNDQFNNRMRGIEGTREVLLITPEEMTRASLVEGQIVALVSDAEDGVDRQVGGPRSRRSRCPIAVSADIAQR